MKKTLLTCLLCFCGAVVWAQDLSWAPVGARYYYECDSSVVFEITRDTLIQGRTCSIEELVSNPGSLVDGLVNWRKIITYAQGDTVFIYDAQTNAFYELFNWDAEPGYEYTFRGLYANLTDFELIMKITVQDTSSIIRNNVRLKTYSFSGFSLESGQYNQGGITWEGIAIQFLGNNRHRYPISGIEYPPLDRYRKATFPGGPDTLYLLDLSTISEPIPAGCSRYTSRAFSRYPADFSIYPNPVVDNLFIDAVLLDSKPINITVVDIYGKLILSDILMPNVDNTYKLCFESLPKGIYILTIDKSYSAKIIKI